MEMFCSLRMVTEYTDRFYLPAAKRFDSLLANQAEEARNLATHIKRLRSLWKNIEIQPPVRKKRGPYRVGEQFDVTAEIRLAELQPHEVDVELYYGHMKSLENVVSSTVEPMNVIEDRGNGHFLYGCTLTCQGSGRFGFTVRVTPRGDERVKSTPRLLTWA
jgi:starch phosphorylase